VIESKVYEGWKMIIIYLIIAVTLTLLTKIMYGSIYKVNMLFNIVWCIFGGLSTLELFGLYKPNNIIHLYVIVSIVVFNFVYIIFSKIVKNKWGFNKSIGNIVGKPNYKIIYIVNTIALFYSVSFIPKAWMIMNNYGYDVLRTYAFKASEIYASTIELTIFQNIVNPIFIATSIVCAVSVALKKSTKTLIILAIIDIAVYTFLFAGRLSLVKFIAFFLFSFCLVYKKSLFKFLIRNKKYIVLGFLAFVFFSYLTIQRSTSSVFEQAVIYLSAPFIMLSNLNDMAPWENNLLLGKATFGFIIGPFEKISAILLNTEYSSASYVITSITSIRQTVGDGISFNALTTMLFPFMMDFGKLGIVIGTAIFAVLVTMVEFKYKTTYSLFWLSLYIYILYNVPVTVMNYFLLNSSEGFILLFLLIFTKKVTFKKKQKNGGMLQQV
jgi:oligosaccharide repeat unit polymerase